MGAIRGAIRDAIRKWIPDVTVSNIDIKNQQDGIEYVYIELILPDNTLATLPISTASFNINGTVTR